MFTARLAETVAVRDFVDAACAAWEVERTAAYKLHLIAEELFINTVKHGHGGDGEGLVAIALACHADHLTLTYQDDAPAFNPFRYAETVNAAAGASEQRVGGLGVLLVCELSSASEYAYLYGRNRVRVKVARSFEGRRP
jgi:anti-sigma regulatory factor (Ser/Thr protein kinase)